MKTRKLRSYCYVRHKLAMANVGSYNLIVTGCLNEKRAKVNKR